MRDTGGWLVVCREVRFTDAAKVTIMTARSRDYASRSNRKSVERSFQEFRDAIQTADDEIGFARIARRITERFGFRWFAYLGLSDDTRTLISSYPKSWTDRYFDPGYQ
jgi:hypothetical protein